MNGRALSDITGHQRKKAINKSNWAYLKGEKLTQTLVMTIFADAVLDLIIMPNDA